MFRGLQRAFQCTLCDWRQSYVCSFTLVSSLTHLFQCLASTHDL
uniref:Uncharacterized protein n=1 Tax=Rhizophora mucronata TaxID=61149 RepID=A0A2P2NC49_RHIMU